MAAGWLMKLGEMRERTKDGEKSKDEVVNPSRTFLLSKSGMKAQRRGAELDA